MRAPWATLGSIALLVAALTVAGAAPASAQKPGNDAQERQFNALIDEGIDQRRAHDYRASIATLNKALALARATKSLKNEAEALGFLAISYRELPDLQQVLTLRLQTLELVRANPKVFTDESGSEEPW